MAIIRYSLGEMDNNTYLIVDETTKKGALVDPSFGSEALLPDILERVSNLKYVLNTHAHFDHVVGNAFYVEKTGALLALHRLDLPLLRMLQEQGRMFGYDLTPSPDPTIFLEEGQPLQLGETTIQVLATPGHSPGPRLVRCRCRSPLRRLCVSRQALAEQIFPEHRCKLSCTSLYLLPPVDAAGRYASASRTYKDRGDHDRSRAQHQSPSLRAAGCANRNLPIFKLRIYHINAGAAPYVAMRCVP